MQRKHSQVTLYSTFATTDTALATLAHHGTPRRFRTCLPPRGLALLGTKFIGGVGVGEGVGVGICLSKLRF